MSDIGATIADPYTEPAPAVSALPAVTSSSSSTMWILGAVLAVAALVYFGAKK